MPETIDVDTTVSAPMASSAYGNGTVYFRITGTCKLLLDQASSPNFSVAMKRHFPSIEGGPPYPSRTVYIN
jgi:hypothetical protein